MTKHTTTTAKRPALRRTTLRQLSADQLHQIAGGAARQSQCTRDYSGCIQ